MRAWKRGEVSCCLAFEPALQPLAWVATGRLPRIWSLLLKVLWKEPVFLRPDSLVSGWWKAQPWSFDTFPRLPFCSRYSLCTLSQYILDHVYKGCWCFRNLSGAWHPLSCPQFPVLCDAAVLYVHKSSGHRLQPWLQSDACSLELSHHFETWKSPNRGACHQDSRAYLSNISLPALSNHEGTTICSWRHILYFRLLKLISVSQDSQSGHFCMRNLGFWLPSRRTLCFFIPGERRSRCLKCSGSRIRSLQT